MQFIDEALIHVRAGDGGDGCAAFRREAHTPFGGPAGGDGGDGGSVILLADPQLSTLLDLKYRKHIKAKRGENGRNKDQYGKRGENRIVRVPVGTVAFDATTNGVLGDLSQPGQELLIAQGGKGGRGNIHFKSSYNQAPRQCEPGTPGEQLDVRLELKLLADVGLLGFPNVGKSTLIAHTSRAKPRIADYPFTTLVPNLGVVALDEERSFVMADIPGLIRGAAQGQGLGHRFLRHVERSRVLLHLLDASDLAGENRTPLDDFQAINAELAEYAPELAAKPQIVALNKRDLTEVREQADDWVDAFAHRGVKLHMISAATGEGVREVLEALWQIVRKQT